MRSPRLRRLLQRVSLPAALRHGAFPAKERAREASEVLARSEDTLTAVESKGQALTSITAMVAAPIGLAISLTWSDSTTLARCLLTAAAAYVLKSVRAPFTLAAPAQRALPPIAATTRLPDLQLRAATLNHRRAQHLTNLLVSSRRDLLKAILLFTTWAALALAGFATDAQSTTEKPNIPAPPPCRYVTSAIITVALPEHVRDCRVCTTSIRASPRARPSRLGHFQLAGGANAIRIERRRVLCVGSGIAAAM